MGSRYWNTGGLPSDYFFRFLPSQTNGLIGIFISIKLTNSVFFSIKGIDKINHVCYTDNQLEHKIKNLTNKKNKNKKEQPHGETNKYIKL